MRPDVIVVGSGPAGVSACFPLVEAGAQVLMLDGGLEPDLTPPRADQLGDFQQGEEYRSHLLGPAFEGLAWKGTASPKLRLPANRYAVSGFNERYGVQTEGFRSVGSLARGGLSSIWGAGIAEYGEVELSAFPFEAEELHRSYVDVARRVGVSGVAADDVSDYLGTETSLQPPSPLGPNASRLLERYEEGRGHLNGFGVYMGRARNAVLTKDEGTRLGCNRCGHCLWGCHRDSIYSSSFDLEALSTATNFSYRGGVFVTRVEGGAMPRVTCSRGGGDETIEAPRVILACGAVGSTILVLRALAIRGLRLRLLSTPTAGIGLLIPTRLGQPSDADVFGLSQLTFIHRDSVSGDVAAGNLFEAAPVPITDLGQHVGFLRPVARRILRSVRPAMLVGNAFFSGEYSQHEISLTNDGAPFLRGGFSDELTGRLARLRSAAARAFRGCGAMVLPGSFKTSDPGSDVHYAGTLPMRSSAEAWETTAECEVAGLPGVYVVDGAALPVLPAKAHTLTIMANADRVGRRLAGTVLGEYGLGTK